MAAEDVQLTPLNEIRAPPPTWRAAARILLDAGLTTDDVVSLFEATKHNKYHQRREDATRLLFNHNYSRGQIEELLGHRAGAVVMERTSNSVPAVNLNKDLPPLPVKAPKRTNLTVFPTISERDLPLKVDPPLKKGPQVATEQRPPPTAQRKAGHSLVKAASQFFSRKAKTSEPAKGVETNDDLAEDPQDPAMTFELPDFRLSLANPLVTGPMGGSMGPKVPAKHNIRALKKPWDPSKASASGKTSEDATATESTGAATTKSPGQVSGAEEMSAEPQKPQQVAFDDNEPRSRWSADTESLLAERPRTFFGSVARKFRVDVKKAPRKSKSTPNFAIKRAVDTEPSSFLPAANLLDPQ
ncbi:MAG: hypothetical protein Q9162_001692 [Coniocarpon cinnabarinum]